MYHKVLDWSEIWAFIIPLTVFFIKKNKEKCLLIAARYLSIAIIINTSATIIWWYNKEYIIDTIHATKFSPFLRRNNYLYNIHSIIRTVFFILFFNYAGSRPKWFNANLIIGIFLLAAVVDFLFFDDFFIISSQLFTLEGIILLICCVSFFLERLKDDELHLDFDPPLIIVTGLTVYEGISFFIFLFYNVLMLKEKNFAINIWDVHNISFIIFCMFIAYAFYGRSKLVFPEKTESLSKHFKV